MRTFTFILTAGLVVLAPLPPAAADDFDGAALYDKCVKSTVFIVVPHKEDYRLGSGSLIDSEKKLVITNSHVIGEADSVFCQFPVRNKDGTVMQEKKKYLDRVPAGFALKGTVLYRDLKRDLALVRLDKLPPDTPAIPLAKTSPRPGEKVIDIMNPQKMDSAFNAVERVVRAVGIQDVAVGDQRIKAKVVTVTNPVGVIDSGGPLIDRRGHLVAVMQSVNIGQEQNVIAAIDITEVRAFLTEKKIKLTEPADGKDK